MRTQDCEFTYLSVQILHLLGEEGPKTKEPSKYIRYIYNRVILENATIRAAAVATLAKFALQVADLRDRVLVLLRRALFDNDDEVCSCNTHDAHQFLHVHKSYDPFQPRLFNLPHRSVTAPPSACRSSRTTSPPPTPPST